MIRSLITIFVTIFTLNAYANDIYVTQSGASLDLDITQDGQNNQVGNSTTASTVAGASTTIGNSNDIDLDIGETSDASNTTATITSAGDDDSNVIAATIDGTSAILTITVDGDTNNWLIDIDGNGDVNGHTLIHSHTGGIADVDIVQSGINDQMITLTTSGDNADIDISQTD